MDDNRTSGSGGDHDEDHSEGRARESGGAGPWLRALRDVAPHLDLGWRLAGTASFPPLIGFVVDLWLGTSPWLLLGGCGVGLAGAVMQLTRLQADE